jgi:CRISPR/Cas system-associated exonuclease Cas4 (RecB family)
MNLEFGNANPDLLSSNDIIRQLEPRVIPRVSAIARIALCERAAYNISFFGMESSDYSADGEIGNAVHRITIKSFLEIISLSKAGGRAIRKESGIGIFEDNAKADIDTNWKRFLLAKVDKPFDSIMDDLYTRGDRLVDKLITEEEENKHSAFRPEFTIRNIHLPLEGRLDLIRIKISNPSQNSYVSLENLQNLDGAKVQVTQIKTGRFKRPSAVWKLQADAETLLLMKAFNLQTPPEYIWQFSDKDSHKKKFNFAKVHQYIDRYIQLWKSEVSPDITGYCPNCSLKEGCLEWAFAPSGKLTENELIRRRSEFNLSKRIREEISHEDRWKEYVGIRNAEQRQAEGSSITNLTLDTNTIDTCDQTVTLLGDQSFGQFLDFSVGDHVTVSDGNPNIGSNPTATITDIDLIKKSITLRFHRGDMYYLLHEGRHKSIRFTLDRFNFTAGLISMRYLDNFFRRSPYADVILQYRKSILLQKANEEKNTTDSTKLLEDNLKRQNDTKSESDSPEEYDV